MKVRDPVCGMRIESEEAVATAEHENETYYFCAEGCRKAFEEDPERYLQASEG